MLTRKSELGHIIWLTEGETEHSNILQEIESLKSMGQVVVLKSGTHDIKWVIERLLQENKEALD